MNRLSRWLSAVALIAVLATVLASMPLIGFAAYENTHVNTGNQAADLVAVAKTQIGYVEGSNNYNKYAEYFGNANQPWCGYFISWCARQANIPTAIIPSSGLASAFKNIGTFRAPSSGYIPKMGDLVVFSYGHVSIVERYDASTDKVWLIDGNWSDKVSNHSISRTDSSVSGYTAPSYTGAVKELTAFNLVKPSVILKGKAFSIGGLICSTKNITKVSVTVQDADGKTKINASATPNAKEYDLAGLDSKVAFGTLVAGEYSYIVSATDASGASKRWSNTFEVVSEVTMTISDVKAPTSLEVGKTFSIYGKITCLENLTQVSVAVYDSANTYKTGGTAQPNTTTYDIHGIDNYVSFGKLAAGSYTMRVSARSASAYKTWEYPFVVGTTASFTASNMVTPSTIVQGKDFDVSGRISCNLSMTAVSVKVLSAAGSELQSASLSPNATSCEISAVNGTLDFSKLSPADYVLLVTAKSNTFAKEWRYSFVVKKAVTITVGDVVHPELLETGTPFDVFGVVTSSEKLDAVTLNILDANDAALSTVTANPGTTTYEIRQISDSVPFSKMAAGSYTFRILARSGDTTAEWRYPFTVVDDVDSLKKGDINFDGAVDTIDTMLLFIHVSGGQPLTDAQLANVGEDDPDMITAMKLFSFTSGARESYP